MKIHTTSPRIESKYITNNIGLNKFLLLFKKNGFVRSFPNRIVNSLYYDNLQFSSIKDNLAGITPRNKFRLRWYGDKKSGIKGYQFEKKIKLNLTGFKKIYYFSSDFNIFSIDFSMDGLQNITKIYDQSLLPLNYKPQLLCSYERQYFENAYSVRLTIDSKIKFWSFKNNIRYSLSKPFAESSYIILEIKYEPSYKDILLPIFRKLPFPSTRCSKYLLGHARLNRVNYI